MFRQDRLRKGQPDLKLGREAFIAEYKKSFHDQRFRSLDKEIEKIAQVAWQFYNQGINSPQTLKATEEFRAFDAKTVT